MEHKGTQEVILPNLRYIKIIHVALLRNQYSQKGIKTYVHKNPQNNLHEQLKTCLQHPNKVCHMLSCIL